MCARLAGRAARLAEITGLPLDPYFAAPKMTWLRENVTSGGVVTTTDTWLLARLGAGYVTDAATASRTMLLDLDATAWSRRRARCSAWTRRAARRHRLRRGHRGDDGVRRALPVAGLAVDQQAALLAERCLAAGEAKCTYGTGAFLLVTTGRRGRGRPPACPPRSPGGWPGSRRTAWTARSTRPGRRFAGWARSA